MFIEKTIKLEEGSVTFKGEFSDEELDLVITAGLTFLVMNGSIPITAMEGYQH